MEGSHYLAKTLCPIENTLILECIADSDFRLYSIKIFLFVDQFQMGHDQLPEAF